MATFSDLMNLLLCFFVLLFSMSSVYESKAEAMIKSLADTFSIFTGGGSSFEDGVLVSSGAHQISNLDEYYNTTGKTDDGESVTDVDQTDHGAQGDHGDTLHEHDENDSTHNGESEQNGQGGNNNENQASSEKMTDEQIAEAAAARDLAENQEQSGIIYEEVVGLTDKFNLGDYVDVVIDAETYEFVEIEINGAVLFDSGEAEIRKDAVSIISKLGDILKQYRGYKIEVIGHTDNVPTTAGAKYATNELLSAARAISVATYFAETKGMGWSNIYFSGRGEHEPVADNSTNEGRTKNRRVEIRLYNLKNSD